MVKHSNMSYLCRAMGLFNFRRNSLSQFTQSVRQQNLTYLSKAKLLNLEHCLRTINKKKVAGMCLEAGVAAGGSAIIIANLMGSDRVFRGYDVFGMIPAPSERDDAKSKARYETIAAGESTGIKGDSYYGYEDNLYDLVVSRFEANDLTVDGSSISLHRGLFDDTLFFEAGDTVAFAHIDCDWHDPVALCLERIGKVLSSGGFIVIDDYHDYGGCKEATDAFLATHDDFKVVTDDSNLVIRRG